MLIDKYTSRFLKIEEENNLFELKSNGEHFWNYLRYSFFEEIAFKNKTNERIEMIGSRLIDLPKKIYQFTKNYIIPLFKKIKVNKDSKVAIFNYSIYLNENGNYINQLSYYLSKILSDEYNTTVLDNHGMVNKLTGYQVPIIDIRPIFVKSKFLSLFAKNSPFEIETIDKLETIFFKNFNYRINKKNYLNKIKFSRIYLNTMKAFFKNSELRMIAFSNNGSMAETIRAAKYNKVKTIDFQHSIISQYNILYNYPKNKGKYYTEDYLVTWGEGWSNNCSVNSKILDFGSISKFDFNISKKIKKINDKNIMIIGNKKNRVLLSNVATMLSKNLSDHFIYYKLRPEENNHWKKIFQKIFVIKLILK